MFFNAEHFTTVWKQESQATARLLEKLTDASLALPKGEDIRTVGRAAWHVVTTMPEMAGHVGIPVEGVTYTDPVPARAAVIVEAYRKAAASILKAVEKWPEADFLKEDDMYGQMWKRGQSLWALVTHEIHHRGQLTVLMRLAGLPVVGVYGPSKEEWSQYGAKPPEV
ncbi:MAG: DinB family protein [candidate division Zixibacteria bacterium]|nr:DinB family protein [candidate division Zixibacteria bacterium]